MIAVVINRRISTASFSGEMGLGGFTEGRHQESQDWRPGSAHDPSGMPGIVRDDYGVLVHQRCTPPNPLDGNGALAELFDYDKTTPGWRPARA